MSLVYYFLSFIAGLALTLQVSINTQLRLAVNSPLFSSLISFAIGTIALAIIFFFSLSSGNYSLTQTNFSSLSLWLFSGGLLGAFYVFITILASPKIGFANLFSLVLCWQVLLAVLLDHYGILGNTLHAFTPLRALGVLFLIAGVYLIHRF